MLYVYDGRFVSIMESMHRMPLLVHVAANVSVLSLLGFQVNANYLTIVHQKLIRTWFRYLRVRRISTVS